MIVLFLGFNREVQRIGNEWISATEKSKGLNLTA